MTTARQPRNKAPLRLAENGIICVGVFQRYPADPGDRADPAVDPAEEEGPDAREGQDGAADPEGPTGEGRTYWPEVDRLLRESYRSLRLALDQPSGDAAI